MAELYTTLGESTLLVSISSVATALTVLAAASFPPSGSFRIRIDDEILQVTGVSGDDFTVVRGTEGTTAAGHLANAPVIEVLTAAALTAILAQSGAGLLAFDRFVTSAEIENLNEEQIELVPAPGAGKYLKLVSFSGSFLAGASPFQFFGSGDNNFDAAYGTPGLELVASLDGFQGNTIAGLTAPAGVLAICRNNGFSTSVPSGVENQPLVTGLAPGAAGAAVATSLSAGGSDYQAGDIGVIADGANDTTVVVDTVDGGGAVLTFHVSSLGQGGVHVGTFGVIPFLPIRTALLNAGGALYAVDDVFLVDGSGGTPAFGHVTAVDGGGAVTAFVIDSPGDSYTTTVGETTAAQTGIGTGLTLDITAGGTGFFINVDQVQAFIGGDGTMRFTGAYQICDR